MTTPDTYLSRVDPSHIWTICAGAAPGRAGDVLFVIAGEHYGARACLPARPAARAAHAALNRVGYQVVPATEGNRRGRDLTVCGWSARGLESRLTAMRGVLGKLGSEPGSTAATALDQLGRLPATELPDEAGRLQLVQQAGRQLRGWISVTSGIHAPCDPLARPADAGCALRLSATWRAEQAIDDLVARHLRVTWHALALYPGLRQTRNHDIACESAVRQAGIASHLSDHLARDTTPLVPGGDSGTGSPPRAAAETSTRSRPGSRAAREFPATPAPATRDSRRPSTPEASPRGRTFPSGRPGQHRRVR